MSFEPNPKQALLLWNMIAGVTPEQRRPMQSKTKPELDPKKRDELVAHGFLSKMPGEGKGRSRATFLELTERAWAWAGRTHDVELMTSKLATPALQGLLHRLIPFLERQDLALADLFRDDEHESGHEHAHSGEHASDGEIARSEAPVPPVMPPSTAPAISIPDTLGTRIERACLSLAGGARKSRVRLSALRQALPAVPRQELDTALIDLQREHRLVLYREDNTPALTPEDHAAALLVGGSPRHLVYLEA